MCNHLSSATVVKCCWVGFGAYPVHSQADYKVSRSLWVPDIQTQSSGLQCRSFYLLSRLPAPTISDIGMRVVKLEKNMRQEDEICEGGSREGGQANMCEPEADKTGMRERGETSRRREG